MKNEKEIVYNNVNKDAAIKELHRHKKEILNNFAAAYLAETELMPSEIQLVEEQEMTEDGKIQTIYFFRRKHNE